MDSFAKIEFTFSYIEEVNMKTSIELFIQRFSVLEYLKLIRTNRNYRLYLISHMCQHAGDWFVRIAALISVQRITSGSSTALAFIVLCRTVPEVLVAPVSCSRILF